METAAQIIGVFAMAFNIWSYQQKQQKSIIALQLGGSLLFGVHYFKVTKIKRTRLKARLFAPLTLIVVTIRRYCCLLCA